VKKAEPLRGVSRKISGNHGFFVIATLPFILFRSVNLCGITFHLLWIKKTYDVL
jgi:hypothetical protein